MEEKNHERLEEEERTKGKQEPANEKRNAGGNNMGRVGCGRTKMRVRKTEEKQDANTSSGEKKNKKDKS